MTTTGRPPVSEAAFDIVYEVAGPPNVEGLSLFVDQEHDIAVYGVGTPDSRSISSAQAWTPCGGRGFGCAAFEEWPPIVSGRPPGLIIDQRYRVGARAVIAGRDGCYADSVEDTEDPGRTTYSMTCAPWGVVFFSFRAADVTIDHTLHSYYGLLRMVRRCGLPMPPSS